MPHSPIISIIQCDSPNKHSSSVHNRNYLIYIATRDGVDLTPVELERELRQLAESEPTSPEPADNEQYLKYIHERPGSQGLFGNVDTSNPYQLGKELANLTTQGHLVYRGIISLTEDDALNLGFDQKENWVNYMNTVMPDVAREFNIPIDKLQWTAAFHIKDGHPHCHYMFWNKEKRVASPFIHVSRQHAVRELLAKEMFQLEREQAVITKTVARDLLVNSTKRLAADELQFLYQNPDKLTGYFSTKDVKAFSKELLQLASALPTSGRLAYKYLPKECKEQVDALVDKMLRTQPLALDYYQYLHAVDDISATYSASKQHSDVTRAVADEDLRKRLGNVVLKSCKQLLQEKELLSLHDLRILESTPGELGAPDLIPDNIPEPFIPEEDFGSPSEVGSLDSTPDNIPEPAISEEDSNSPDEPGSPDGFVMEWSDSYKEAMSLLYDDTQKDKDGALKLLNSEVSKGNVLAIHSLAQIYDRGLFGCIDSKKTAALYKQSYAGFQKLLSDSEYLKMQPYIHYRLGKYCENGLGTEQDYDAAISHYKQAPKNKYAQYALANMYLRGKGIVLDPENKPAHILQAATLLRTSADSGFPYAAYSYAKLCEEYPLLIKESSAEIDFYYSIALRGFETSISKQPDDNLYYRLGTMHYAGKGTSPDQKRAYEYFLTAAEYNNSFAQYALGKTYADETTEYYNLSKAEEMFLLASDNGNVYATYSLGKLYSTPGDLYNPIAAEKHFKESSSELPDISHYALGKLYSDATSPLYNLNLATEHLGIASDLGNDHAQYTLAKIYLQQDSPAYDFERGFALLQQSANNGNVYATYSLGKLYSTPGDLYNPIAAEKHFKESSSELPDISHYALGKLYSDTTSPLYNLNLATEHLGIASDLGNDHAQYTLAKIYLQQDSPVYDFEPGFALLQQSANNGNVYAMARLGSMYLWGTDKLKSDEALGKYWINKAIEGGNEQAQDTLHIYNNYKQEIATGLTFSLCRNILRTCSSRQNPDSINSIVTKVHSREAAKDREKKSTQEH